jgi:NAD(P)-dependent dehydrogenase (short-subunit alcohol dehydrogenase family)
MSVLVITGGSSGIGRATAELFARKGWRVYELSRHERQPLTGVTHMDCDVTDEAQCAAAIAAVLQREARIDVLISNAGFGISGPVEFTRTEDAKRLFDVNFFGALNITKAVLPHMRAQKGGRILYTSSVAAPLSVPYQSFYSASKAAINAMALALQNEVRPFGIKIGCLLPGDVQTGFTDAREKETAGEEVYVRAGKAVAAMEKDERNGLAPEAMAKLFYRMATRRYLPAYTVGGGLYKVFCLLDKILPKTFVNWIEGVMY